MEESAPAKLWIAVGSRSPEKHPSVRLHMAPTEQEDLIYCTYDSYGGPVLNVLQHGLLHAADGRSNYEGATPKRTV